MLSVKEALGVIEAQPLPRRIENVAIERAVGLVLSEDVKAVVSVPSFPTAAMDGYAVRSVDLKNASVRSPVCLKVSADVAAGKRRRKFQKECTVSISTGAEVSSPFDSVVKKEDVERKGKVVFFSNPVSKGKNVRQAKETFRKGETLLQAGVQIAPWHIGLLCQAGVAEVKVYPRPKIAFIGTGSEVVPLGKPCPPPFVYDVSGGVVALLKSFGAEIFSVTHVPDRKTLLRKAVQRASDADIILTLGGISVGKHDIVRDLIKEEKIKTYFYKVNQKPGKPLFLGRYKQALFFGLPGNPLSAFCCLYVYLRPFLQRFAHRIPEPSWESVPLTQEVTRKGNRARFLFGKRGKQGVDVFTPQPSYALLSLSQANGLVWLTEKKRRFPKGSIVSFLPLQEGSY